MGFTTIVVELVPFCKIGLFEQFITVELAHLFFVDTFTEGANLIEGGFMDLEVHADFEHLHVIVGVLRVVDVADVGIAMTVRLEGLIVRGLGVLVYERGVAVGTL